MFEELHVAGLGFDGDIGALEEFDDTDAFFFAVECSEDEDVFGGELCFAAVCESPSFSGIEDFEEDFFVEAECVGAFGEAGLFEVELCSEGESAGVIDDPYGTGAGADGGDDTGEEFVEEFGRGEVLTGELFDLTGQLHDTFAYFPQIFV